MKEDKNIICDMETGICAPEGSSADSFQLEMMDLSDDRSTAPEEGKHRSDE